MKFLLKILFLATSFIVAISVNGQTWSPSGSNLYANPISTNVGIGTSSPDSKLHLNAISGQTGMRVQIAGNTKFTVASNGGVTIGTFYNTPPANGLYVYNQINVNTTSSNATAKLNIKQGWSDWIHFEHTSNTGYWAFHNGEEQETFHIYYRKPDGTIVYPLRLKADGSIQTNAIIANGTIESKDFTTSGGKNIIVGDDAYLSDVDRGNILGIYGMQNNDRAGIQFGSNTNSYIFGIGGNIGIGTTNTDGYKLAVNGKILCEGVKCITDVPNSDFVFECNYRLMDLSEVEKFVKENKHLPEVPSSEDFKKNGYNMGEFDDIMLRKVEQLTLYIIEQNKKIAELQEQLNSLIK